MKHENKSLSLRKRKIETKSERRKKPPDSKDNSPDRAHLEHKWEKLPKRAISERLWFNLCIHGIQLQILLHFLHRIHPIRLANRFSLSHFQVTIVF